MEDITTNELKRRKIKTIIGKIAIALFIIASFSIGFLITWYISSSCHLLWRIFCSILMGGLFILLIPTVLIILIGKLIDLKDAIADKCWEIRCYIRDKRK